VLSKGSDRFFIWKEEIFLFFPLCPIDAQGIELDIEKKAVCFEKNRVGQSAFINLHHP
jgi:hypothetical protein